MSHPEELLLPFVSGDLAPADHDRVVLHLTTCGDCARAVLELRDMHERLRRMPTLPAGVPPAVPASRSRVVRQTVLRAAAALLLIATGAAGMWWWSRPAPPPTGGLYALVFYEPVALRAAQTDAERRDRYRRFAQWQRPLYGRTVDGLKLVDESGRFFVTPIDVRTADRSSLPGLALSGIVIVRGDSYEEVASFVPGCPVFEDGGQVEVRRIR